MERSNSTNRTFGTIRKNVVVMACLLGFVTISFLSNSYFSMLVYNPESQLSFAYLSVVGYVSDQIHENDNKPLLATTKAHMLNDTDFRYIPASSEKYVRDHARQLGYHNAKKRVPTCKVWTDDTGVTVPKSMHDDLVAFSEELKEYNRLVKTFKPISDLRLQLAPDESNIDQVCQQVDMDLKNLFPSRQLSMGPSGLMEPLLPPFRHSRYCYSRKGLMDLTFLVHDFGAMCRKLKRTSRTVLVDMGASLDFHSGATSPAVYLTELYRKFGFPFDHIYAYEVTPKEPKLVFKKVPDHLIASYHWINVGVEKDPTSTLNPLKMLLENFNEDDFIVVKLDIDKADIEVPLARQLLNDTAMHGLVDQFYFEHHVLVREMAPYWLKGKGSVQGSLELFIGLREAGVAAHSWV
jgi:hypothetical protein